MAIISSCDIDTLLRKLGEPKEDYNEIVGIFLGKEVTRGKAIELDLYRDARFLSIARLKTDWKCSYCGCLRPKSEYTCGNCGGPRQ